MDHRSVTPPTPPLAIVGIGCLFPGSSDFAGFWSRVVNRFDAIREVPPSHWRAEDYLDADPKAADRVYAARGGFLDPVAFHPQAFGIPPSNLEATDSSQLLGLLVAREALADCGYSIDGSNVTSIDRSRVSVILGVTGTLQLVIPLGARLGHPIWRRALQEAGVADEVADDVVQRIAEGYVPWQENSFPGLLGNVVAGRIANRFDLGGTNCVVDAACASSLSAIHLAAMELATGKADMVLTGGVDSFNDIFMFTCFSKTPALSPTGNAKPFDASGDGTVLGEGLGMVVLKRLDDARRDGDRVYAILKGVGSSSDGKGGAIYAPRKEGQVEALRNAYRAANVSPDTIELVEAHGTGTKVGDATEVSALAEVYSATGRAGPWCAVGSIKSQIGHTKAAAGVAGLLKATAALYHKVVPPTIKVTQPLDVLQRPDCPLYVATEKRPWVSSADHPRRAAVSAFGFGGSNFHAVLEEADSGKHEIDWTGDVQILAFPAPSREELRRQVQAFPVSATWAEFRIRADQARRAWRADAPWRLVVVVERERFDLARTLTHAADLLDRDEVAGAPGEGIFVGTGPAMGRLAVLFPGQGAQYVGMMRDLTCHFPPAFDAFSETQRLFGSASATPLVDLVYPRPAFSRDARADQNEALQATDVAQPALGAVSLGAWRVLESFGVRGDLFAGHSYGELTALCAAGRLEQRDFFALSQVRGRLLADVRDDGTMLAVKAEAEAIAAILAEEGIDLVLANKNGRQQTVVSGETSLVERALKAFTARRIAAVRLAVSAAFHSPRVAAARAPFRAALAGVGFAPGMPVYANTTAEPYPERADAVRDLLAVQLVSPVEWVREVEAMYAAGARDFLEVGPGGRLTGLVENILAGREVSGWSLDPTSGQRSGFYDLARGLAWLAARGHAVALDRWESIEQPVPIPTSKAGVSVELTGANYVRPRPARPAVTRNGKHESERPVQNETDRRIGGPPVRSSEGQAGSPSHDPGALARALEATRESLQSLQKMQEQAAQLHRQFLEGQEQAHRTVHLLVEQQRRLLQATLGEPVAPMPLPIPAAKPIPSPVVVPPVAVPPTVVAPAPQQGVHAPGSPAVERVLLGVIAEKTGYPEEMLELGMALDADLGIDSIKRVEILSALQERLPDAPQVKPEHLGTLHTLGDIAAFLGRVPLQAATPSSNGHGSDAVAKVLLSVIAEKTGYPEEMLELGMALDADLGIDSIKRVEILSALQERLPDAPQVKPEHLGTLHTLGDIAAFLGTAPVLTPSVSERPAPPVTNGRGAKPVALERSVVRAVPLPATPRSPIHLVSGADVWINDDDPALADAVAELLRARNLVPRRVSLDKLPDTVPVAFVLLAPGGTIEDHWPRRALMAVQRAKLRQSQGVLVTVARLDGAFGLGGATLSREPLDGGLAGLAKTVAREWPEVRAKALDVAPSLPNTLAARHVVEELFQGGPLEVGYSETGALTLERTTEPLPHGSHAPFQAGEVVVVSGGGRGVTAEVAVALARAFRPTLVLLGRTAVPEPEPAWLAGLPDEAALKRESSRRKAGASPRAIGEEVKAVLANREIRHTLARIGQAGAKALYRSVDIRDASALTSLLDEVRRTHGPIRGVIHGAGVLADARIEDKTIEQFDAVYQTKVGGLRALLTATATDDLRALVLFSSSTARFGRVGQVDYAIANEVLNKFACREAVRRPGCRVVAMNWGPWDGGMVTPALKQLFANEGVGVIPLDAGANLLVDELRAGTQGPPEVVVLAAGSAPASSPTPPSRLPQALPTAFERVLDVAEFPVLEDHVLDGRPVLPVVLMLEWLAHAAMVQNPGLAFHGCDDLRVLHGVTLDGPPLTLRVGAAKATRQGGSFVAPAEVRSIRGDGRETLHARSVIVLVTSLPAAPEPQPAPAVSEYPLTPAEVYHQGILFHGETLRGIEAVEGCGEAGIIGSVRAAPLATAWMQKPLRQHWLADPLILDSAFQLLILWTHEHRGAGNLPCHLGRYRQYRRGFPATGTRVVVALERTTEHQAVADLDFLDREGRVIARLEGYECVIDPNLARAFRRNTLTTA